MTGKFDTSAARKHLRAFDFTSLFTQVLGWDRFKTPLQIQVDEESITLDPIAEKRGLVVFTCPPFKTGSMPDSQMRRKIDSKVTKVHHEHIIIYIDDKKIAQIWQWVRREPGKVASREHRCHASQSFDLLIQKLQILTITFQEDDDITIVETARRVSKAFDVEKVTKKFYDRFKKEREAFQKFIDGIPDKDMELWYVSVMLNRLMFIYFIQKKRFLNDDPDYLKLQLVESQKRGKDKFYTKFLCPLFFKGFAERKKDRSDATNRLLGDIPYLNGSIFLKHQIEKLHGKAIKIPDKAFTRLIEFFEEYQWHLDDRPVRKGNEINPDVLGYIFEKYVNQKQMGAYYTKEDITEYISKNTILPWLLERVKGFCAISFEGKKSIWNLLQDEPDRYIYDAMKYGTDNLLPDDIAAGIKDVSKRTGWNVPAPDEFALPTEIWREVVARRQRYEEVWNKLADGKITEVNDLITYNLDIRQFVQDVIESSEGPELIRSFWRALHGDNQHQGISILDPTCGSGAFLFAALNILEPLYEACLEKMQEFMDSLPAGAEKKQPGKYKDFRDELKRIDSHENHSYYILKSIIVNNLYGVDIMEEAVEICKLRLFLKLVSQIDDVDRIEPLPDIDFNIRAGNTLVGYATKEDVIQSSGGAFKFDFGDAIVRIELQAKKLERRFNLFRNMQIDSGYTSSELSVEKQGVKDELQDLNGELNQYLAQEFSIDPSKKKVYQQWLNSHQPFHWFIEFYSIMNAGGFDVIIGNPPYVRYKTVKDYTVLGFDTIKTGDLYSLVMERGLDIISVNGRSSMIVPISLVSTDGFTNLRQLINQKSSTCWILNFAERPSKLFTGVEKRLGIWVIQRGLAGASEYNISCYRRWLTEEREHLFDTIIFSQLVNHINLVNDAIPKVMSNTEQDILTRLTTNKPICNYFIKDDKNRIYYTRKLRYFIQFYDFIPSITDDKGRKREPSELKCLNFMTDNQSYIAIAALNSNLFFWYFSVYSDVRNVNKREIESFPLSMDEFPESTARELVMLSGMLMNDLDKHSVILENKYKDGQVLRLQSFQPRQSKKLINNIDRVLATHYGFTDEELDFIINYDIKYRMGSELNSGEEN